MTIHGVLRRVVRNDAIKVDPPEVYNWRVLALAASVSSVQSCSATWTRGKKLTVIAL
jgi:hypothetical protein